MNANRRALPARQRGISLLLALVMLIMLMALGLSAASITTTSTRVVSNTQHRALAVSTAQRGVEQVLNDIANFTAPTAAVAVAAPAGVAVTVANRECIGSSPATGYSALQPLVPEDTYWRVQVNVTDNVTGAATAMEQGVRIRMLAGSCP